MSILFTKSHPILGLVNYRQSSVAKYISVKMSPNKGVTLVIPKRSSMQEAERFLEKNVDLIHQRMLGIRERNPVEVFGPESVFATRSHQLVLRAVEGMDPERLEVEIDEKELCIDYYPSVDWSETWVQEGIRGAIQETYRLEAKVFLADRVRVLADQFGFQFESLRVRNTRSRWGCCTARNTLSFSLHLMSLPDHLIDLVILHELCHTVHKNHGVHFHALLKQVCPNKEMWERELKGRVMI